MRPIKHRLAKLELRLNDALKGPKQVDTKTLVLPEARAVYIPIPKAANTSVRIALAPCLGFAPETVTDVHHDPRYPATPLSQAVDMADDGWFFFTVVRDPFDRAYSAFYDKVVARENILPALRRMGLEKGDSFTTYLRALNDWPRHHLNDHFIPQRDLLGPALADHSVDIVQMENLDRDWNRICDRIEARGGVRPAPIKMSNSRKSQPKATDRTWSDRDIALMTALFGPDYEVLGYEHPARSE